MDKNLSSISIICCTYNPDIESFERVVKAINKLERPEGVRLEIIVVDNNSNPTVESRNEIKLLDRKDADIKIIIEPQPGLTSARMAGFNSSVGDAIVFFDDDNEPEKDYLVHAAKLFTVNSQVAVWGPGNINVEFVGGEPEPIAVALRSRFQHRENFITEYACVQDGWNRVYPAGTGQMVKRDVFAKYCNLVSNGKYTSTDRIGKSLISAGDVQIVFTAVTMGLAAGNGHTLRLNHLIHSRKANSAYLRRHAYGNAIGYALAYKECFDRLHPGFFEPDEGFIRSHVRSLIWKGIRTRTSTVLDIASFLGGMVGNLRAVGKGPTPTIIKYVERLKLE